MRVSGMLKIGWSAPMRAVFFAAIVGSFQAAWADTNVGGVVSGTATWDAAGNPYVATANVLVAQGALLAINPGVVVKFGDGKSLQIAGEVRAIGTQDSTITLTANADTAAGAWGIIHFTSTSQSAVFDAAGNWTSGSILQYCDISYAGGLSEVNGAVKVDSVSPYISQCTITHNRGGGISAC